MKVKVIKRYSDVMTRKIHEKGMTFETDEKRASHLVKEGVAVILDEKENSDETAEREKPQQKPAKESKSTDRKEQ